MKPPQAQLPSVWIILLNWNGLRDTLACIASLAVAEPGPYQWHLLVIDNGSREDPRPAIEARFPTVEVVRLARNLGFAGGCNLGMQRALEQQADLIVLLNNDTLVAPNFLPPLLDYLQTHPEVGVTGPVICSTTQPEQVWFAGAACQLALGHFKHQFWNAAYREVPQQPFRTGYITGCCMVLRASDLRRLGLFDEAFFAYFEDVELCIRLKYAQLAAVCVPTSRIWHKESTSARRDLKEGQVSPLQLYLMTRNRIMIIRRYGSWLEQLSFFALITPLQAIFYLAAFSVRRRWKKLVWFTLGLVHGLLGRMGGLPQ